MIEDWEKARHEIDVAAAVSRGVSAALIAALDTLTPDDRCALFSLYCPHCGAADTKCICWKDC
jgi:hypothetical protein